MCLRSGQSTEAMKMKKLITIFAAILVVGFVLFLIRQNATDSRNQDAIKRATSVGSNTKPRSNAAQDERHRQRARESPAGKRLRQMQK